MMIRGFMKTTSLTTLVAAAGILMGNLAYAPAKAADLGGGCCADLEERVAELEATTARKGNRVVSLQIYGQVNKALMIWDDGEDSDAYVVDNDVSGSRIGLIGKATMWAGWTAGYNLEFDYQDAASDKVDNGGVFNTTTGADLSVHDDGNPSEIVIRYNNVFIESDRLGRITMGQQSSPADGINEIVLGNSLSNAGLYWGNSFVVQGTQVGTGIGSAFFQVKNFVTDLDGNRLDLIRYDSPEIYGFIVSASWGENDYADLTLRFKREWNSIRIAAGIGYQWQSEFRDLSPGAPAVKRQEVLSGSISVMHVPTGIYGAFAAGEATNREPIAAGLTLTPLSSGVQDQNFWYLQLGFERRLLPYGSTTMFGEYGNYDDFAFDGSQATRWGFGVVQKIDSAAMELYAQYFNYSFDNYSITEDAETTDYNPQDFSTVLIGSRIKF